MARVNAVRSQKAGLGETLRRVTLAALVSVSLGGLMSTAADAMTVQPVVLDLQTSGRGMSQVITVENTFATPLPVELRVEELGFVEGGLKSTGKDPGDLVIYPPQALIEPGQTQSFRIQFVGDAALAQSKHYYVTVSQLPIDLPEGQSAIQILYDFQVLVSVAPQGAEPAITVAGAEIGRNEAGQPVPVVTFSNASAAHGYVSKGSLVITERDASGARIFSRTLPGPEIQQTIGFGLVGAGQTRRMTLPVELPSGDGTVEVVLAPDAR